MISCVSAPTATPELDLGTMAYGMAHMALRSPAYRDYLISVTDGRRRDLILDNSASELSEGMRGDVYFNLIETVRPDEVVAPDVPEDPEETIIRTHDFVSEYARRGHRYRVMAVPQGNTEQEYRECFAELQSIPEVRVMGIHPNIAFLAGVKKRLKRQLKQEDLMLSENRSAIVTAMAEEGLIKKPIHLLGMSTLDEFYMYSRPALDKIRSNSTSSPFSALSKGRLFLNGHSGPKDWSGLNYGLVPDKHFRRNARWNLFEYFTAVRDTLAINALAGGELIGR